MDQQWLPMPDHAAAELPVIVAGDPDRLAADRWASLADVILTTAVAGAAADLSARLFRLNPDLTLAVLLLDDRTVHIGSRDGEVLVVRADGPEPIGLPWLLDFVILLYAERMRR